MDLPQLQSPVLSSPSPVTMTASQAVHNGFCWCLLGEATPSPNWRSNYATHYALALPKASHILKLRDAVQRICCGHLQMAVCSERSLSHCLFGARRRNSDRFCGRRHPSASCCAPFVGWPHSSQRSLDRSFVCATFCCFAISLTCVPMLQLIFLPPSLLSGVEGRSVVRAVASAIVRTLRGKRSLCLLTEQFLGAWHCCRPSRCSSEC